MQTLLACHGLEGSFFSGNMGYTAKANYQAESNDYFNIYETLHQLDMGIYQRLVCHWGDDLYLLDS
jgi:hypothetical protein